MIMLYLDCGVLDDAISDGGVRSPQFKSGRPEDRGVGECRTAMLRPNGANPTWADCSIFLSHRFGEHFSARRGIQGSKEPLLVDDISRQ